MKDLSTRIVKLPPEQQAIVNRCFHSTGSFMEFGREELEQSIPQRFEKIVQRYPDRIAVKQGDHVLTYAELNALSNKMARALLAQHGDKAEPVGLLFDKGPSLIAAMLGALKAGKFFVLLEPSLPQTRIRAVLKDSRTRILISDRQNALPAEEAVQGDYRIVEFESINCDLPAENLGKAISPGAIAVITYTSGSTGEPKGVIFNHKNLLHTIMLRTNIFHVCAHDRLSLIGSATSSALMNTFNALLTGAALLPFDVKKQGATHLANWLLRERISICLISSPLFRNMCETLIGNEGFSELRVLRLTSEAVYDTDVDLFKKHFSSNTILVNALASSETGSLTKFFIDHESKTSKGMIPLGYPLEDTEILLLDDSGQAVGFNEIGEIAVRSRYLSSGYWDRPALNAAKFKSDPESGEPCLYLTGDLGLMLPDGCLVSKGRKDYRVKIRGYGVEIAEIEKALLEYPGVKEAVVMADENLTGDTRLVAYCVAAGDSSPGIGLIRIFLAARLPEYMIPSTFVSLDALPLTTSGKLDRKALCPPKDTRPHLDTPCVPPRTEVEAELVEIWAEVLRLDKVGIYDNFFELGGHSLAAARIISRVVRTFGLELPIDALFNSPTVADISALVIANQANTADDKTLARILAEVEGLTQEDAQRFLIEEQREK